MNPTCHNRHNNLPYDITNHHYHILHSISIHFLLSTFLYYYYHQTINQTLLIKQSFHPLFPRILSSFMTQFLVSFNIPHFFILLHITEYNHGNLIIILCSFYHSFQYSVDIYTLISYQF